MTALLRIVGWLWLVLVATGGVIAYGVLWIWQGATTDTAGAPVSAAMGVPTILAIAVPGLILIGLAAWLDRRQQRALSVRRLRR